MSLTEETEPLFALSNCSTLAISLYKRSEYKCTLLMVDRLALSHQHLSQVSCFFGFRQELPSGSLQVSVAGHQAGNLHPEPVTDRHCLLGQLGHGFQTPVKSGFADVRPGTSDMVQQLVDKVFSHLEKRIHPKNVVAQAISMAPCILVWNPIQFSSLFARRRWVIPRRHGVEFSSPLCQVLCKLITRAGRETGIVAKVDSIDSKRNIPLRSLYV